MATAIVPRIYDPTLADRDIQIDTEDAYRMVRRLAHEEGMLVGISAGGNIQASVQLAAEFHAAGKQAVIVTILCDGADKYLSEQFWDNEDYAS